MLINKNDNNNFMFFIIGIFYVCKDMVYYLILVSL